MTPVPNERRDSRPSRRCGSRSRPDRQTTARGSRASLRGNERPAAVADAAAKHKPRVASGDQIEGASQPAAALFERSSCRHAWHQRGGQHIIRACRLPRARARPDRGAARGVSGRPRSCVGCALTCALTYPTVRYVGQVGRFDNGDGTVQHLECRVGRARACSTIRGICLTPISSIRITATLTYSELNLFAGVPGGASRMRSRATRSPPTTAPCSCASLIAFLAMWALVRRLTGSAERRGLISAAGYTFCAYTAAHTAEIQLLMIFGFPLVMVAFHALRERPSLATGAWLGAALAAAALASGYYGVVRGRTCGRGYSAVGAEGRPLLDRHRGRAHGDGCCLSAPCWFHTSAIALPRVRCARRPTRGSRIYSATVRDYLTTGTTFGETWLRAAATLKQVALPRWSMPRAIEVLFPGIVMSALAVIGLIRGARDRGDGRTIFGYAVVAALAAWAIVRPRGRALHRDDEGVAGHVHAARPGTARDRRDLCAGGAGGLRVRASSERSGG